MPRSSSAMRVRHLVEEAPVVRDDDAGDVPLQQLFERLDAVDVEVVGGLVEQHEVGRRCANASASAARLRSPPETDAGAASGFTEKRCRNSLSRASRRPQLRARRACSRSRHAAPAIRAGFRPAAAPAPAPRCAMIETRPALHFAGIERKRAEQRAQQRGLAGAVAPDETDAIAGLDGERRAVEQRGETEREFRVLEGDQGHGTYSGLASSSQIHSVASLTFAPRPPVAG